MVKFGDFLKVILIQILLYLIIFIGFSFLWRTLNLTSNLSLIIVLMLALIIYIIFVYKFDIKLSYQLVGIIPMWLLATIYHPHDLFGISDGGTLDFTSSLFDALVVAVLIYLVQCIVYSIIKSFKKK